jgi:hypothetical protein
VQESVETPALHFGEGGELIEWAATAKYLGVVIAADCGLGPELSNRIRLARAAFRRMRPMFAGGAGMRRMRGSFSRVFVALVSTVLLYGSEAWALSAAELRRLEVVCRSMLRQAVPAARRRDISNETLAREFRVPSVRVQLAQVQLRWLGHLARMDDARIARRLLGAQRVDENKPGRGNCGDTLLGVFGKKGVLLNLISEHLTMEARRKFFDGARATVPWFELAQRRSAWRDFVGSLSQLPV